MSLLLPRKLSQLSTTHRNVAGTIASTLTVQLFLLVSGVAVARMLGPVDRGHFALLWLLAGVLALISTFGLPFSLTYWIARDPALGLPLLLRVRRTVALQFAGLLVVHAGILFAVFHDADPYVQRAAALSLAGAPPTALWMYSLAILQANHQFKALNLSRLLGTAVTAVLQLTYWATGIGTLFLVTLSWILLYWTGAAVTVVAGWRGLAEPAPAGEAASRLPSIREMTSFGLKAQVGAVTPLEGFQLDQIIVGLFVSARALGLYVVAVAFTNLPRFISQAIGIVAYPAVAADREGRGARHNILNFMAITLAACGAAVLMIELLAPTLVPRLFGRAFSPAIAVTQILAVSTLFFALRRVLTECARGIGRPGIGSIAEVVSFAFLVPSVALLFHPSARGVALSLVVCSAAGLATIVVGLLARPLERPAAGTTGDEPHVVMAGEVSSPGLIEVAEP